jgi:hypothetical protein
MNKALNLLLYKEALWEVIFMIAGLVLSTRTEKNLDLFAILGARNKVSVTEMINVQSLVKSIAIKESPTE